MWHRALRAQAVYGRRAEPKLLRRLADREQPVLPAAKDLQPASGRRGAG